MDPQDQPPPSTDLLLLRSTACNADTENWRFHLLPERLEFKKYSALQAKDVIPQKNLGHGFQHMSLSVSCVRSERSGCFLFLHSTLEILKTTE